MMHISRFCMNFSRITREECATGLAVVLWKSALCYSGTAQLTIKGEFVQDAAKNGPAQYEESFSSTKMTLVTSDDVHSQYY